MIRSDEESFYRGLDRLKQKKGFCNCWTMAIFFVCLLGLSLLAIFSFFKAVKFAPEEGSTPSLAQDAELVSEVDLGEGTLEVIISEVRFCSIVTAGDEAMARKITCHISEEGVEIVGRFSFWLPANSRVKIMPKARLGKLDFEVVEVSVGKVAVPVSLAGGLPRKSLQALGGIEQLQGAKVKDVELRQGVMVVLL